MDSGPSYSPGNVSPGADHKSAAIRNNEIASSASAIKSPVAIAVPNVRLLNYQTGWRVPLSMHSNRRCIAATRVARCQENVCCSAARAKYIRVPVHAIVTTAAAKDLVGFHPRMPAIIPPDAFDLWLNCRVADAETASALLVPARVGALRFHEVSSAVNRHVNDDASLIAEITDAQRTAEDAPPRKPKAPGKPVDDGQGSLF